MTATATTAFRVYELPWTQSPADERRVRREGERHREAVRRVGPPVPFFQDLRDRHGPFSLRSSVTIPRLSTPRRFRTSIVSTTTPYGRFRSALR